MSNLDLTKPNRQSTKGLLLIFAMSIRKLIGALWPILLIYVWKNDKFAGYQSEIVLGAIIISIFLVIHAILYFLNFKFYVDNKHFILKKGYLQKQELNIPFDRIQSVNYKANVLQRLLKVVSLEIDTAGSDKAELKILALELEFAEELKMVLSNTSKPQEIDNENQAVITEKQQTESLLKLNLGELIKIGLLQNHLKMAIIILAFGWQFYNELAESFKEEVNKVSGQVSEQLLQSSLFVLIFVGLVFFIISIAASVVRIVIKHFEFEFSKADNSFQMQTGLLNRKNVIIPFKKIQELAWGTSPLKKAFGLFSIKIKQASSEIEKKKSSMEIPGCEHDNLIYLRKIVFGENEFINNKQYKISNAFFWRVLFIMGFLPLIILIPISIHDNVPIAIPIIWFAFSVFGSWLALKKRYFRISDNQLIVSKGMFAQDWKQLEMYKIQVVDFKQSVFQKSSGLASIIIYTASGRTSIPFIDENLAKGLHKFLLYKIQSAEKSWM